MIQKLLIVTMGLGLLGVSACLDCRRIDCYNGVFGTLEYRSKSDSTNLFADGTFDIVALRIQQLRGSVASEFVTAPLAGGTQVPILWNDLAVTGFVFSPAVGVSDTMWVYTERGPESECCGSTIVLRYATVGADTVAHGLSDGLILIYK
jgi:hypothetical protein